MEDHWNKRFESAIYIVMHFFYSIGYSYTVLNGILTIHQFRRHKSRSNYWSYEMCSLLRCACTYNAIQDGAEKADKRKTKPCLGSPCTQDNWLGKRKNQYNLGLAPLQKLPEGSAEHLPSPCHPPLGLHSGFVLEVYSWSLPEIRYSHKATEVWNQGLPSPRWAAFTG